MATIGGLLLPDLYTSGQQAFKDGQAQLAHRTLAQYAQPALNGDQGALAKIYGVDPGTAIKVQQFGQQQQKAAQEHDQKDIQHLGQSARMILAAANAGDMQLASNIYKTVVPEVQKRFPGDYPAEFDASMLPTVKGIADATDPADKKDLINVGAGGTVFDLSTRQPIFQNPGVPKAPQIATINLPDNTTQQFENTPQGLVPLQLAPHGQAAAQDPMSSIIQRANALAQSGVPDAQVQQFITQQAQSAGVQMTPEPGQMQGQPPDVGAAPLPANLTQPESPQQPAQATPASGMQLGRSAPKTGNTVATLSPDEIKQIGLPEGTIAQRDQSGKINVVGKGISVQGDANVPMPGDTTKTGSDYISTLPPSVAALTAGLLDGTKPWPSGTLLKNPLWTQAVVAAQHADPSFNASTYKQREQTRAKFTNGKQGDMLRQLRTISAHADQYARDVVELDNSNFTPGNALTNKVTGAFGNQAPGNVDTDALALSEEVSKFLTGGVPAVTTINEWKEQLGSNASRKQQLSRLTRVIGIVGGQLQSLVHQYKSGMGPVAQPLSVIAPESVASFKSLVSAATSVGIQLPPHVAELQHELDAETPPTPMQSFDQPQQAQSGQVLHYNPATGKIE